MLSLTGQGHLERTLWLAALSSAHTHTHTQEKDNESPLPFNRLIAFSARRLYFDPLMLYYVIILPIFPASISIVYKQI